MIKLPLRFNLILKVDMLEENICLPNKNRQVLQNPRQDEVPSVAFTQITRHEKKTLRSFPAGLCLGLFCSGESHSTH